MPSLATLTCTSSTRLIIRNARSGIAFDSMIQPQQQESSEIVPSNIKSLVETSNTAEKEKFSRSASAASSGMSDAARESKGLVPATAGVKNTHSVSEAPWHGSNLSLPYVTSSLCTDERRSRLAALLQQLRLLSKELWESTDVVFSGRGTFLLALGPVVIVGNSFGMLSEATCFALAGIALIPCAERLSYLTEQVAEHTNGTIGALLNATFGNAPELLISVAALRSGFYRVVQLTMLGSMITNMILVFGVSCLIGGLRWQVQDLRLTSGNVSVGMLLMATAGSLIPAALVLSGQFTPTTSGSNNRQLNRTILGAAAPTQEEVTLSRVNAAVMLIAYLCYIVFQLGTHKEEFDERIEERPAQPNVFCRKLCSKCTMSRSTGETDHPRKDSSDVVDRGLKKRQSNLAVDASGIGVESDEESHHFSDEEEALLLHQFNASHTEESFAESYGRLIPDISERRKRRHRRRVPEKVVDTTSLNPTNGSPKKALATGISMTKSFDSFLNEDHISLDDLHRLSQDHPVKDLPNPALSLHVGVIWLFVITLCVSAISDILVDTIDEFALRMNLSQVFTSMIIVPFFSNVAEQVSAFLFAYRNEMDLVVGVTIGSAIQIATFVLPGSVLIGYVMDRSMTLYFHSYETVCLLLCTLIVAAVLQGGTTNWLVGVMLLGVYIMFAAGIWFHEIENLSVDTEELVEAVH